MVGFARSHARVIACFYPVTRGFQDASHQTSHAVTNLALSILEMYIHENITHKIRHYLVMYETKSITNEY
jgi:hypothetical protein